MKRFFIILFSTAMLISVAFFVSCGDESSSDDGSPSGGSFVESPGTTTLSALSGLTATAASSSSVEVSWYPVSGAVGYYVYASEYSSSSTASLVSTTSSTSTTVTDLEAGTKYYFWVKAYKGTTTSDYSSYAYATTEATSSGGSSDTTTTWLSAPTGLKASNEFENGPTSDIITRLEWDAVDGATSYRVYQDTKTSPSYASYVCTTTSTSTIIKGLKMGQIYFFWVEAVNSTARSGYSSRCSIYGLN